MNDSGRFGNGPKSADAFAAIASELLRAGRGCQAPRKHDERRCLALFEAAGAAETTGGFLVNCTAPGIFEARSLWRGYLDAVAQYERHPTEVRPAIPKVPTCD